MDGGVRKEGAYTQFSLHTCAAKYPAQAEKTCSEIPLHRVCMSVC